MLEFIQKQQKHDIILYQGINQSGSSTFSVTGSVCGQVTQEKEEKKLIVLLQNFISPCKKVSSNCEP